ncbi:MAG: hypothetical protein HY211_07905 [Candidatus Omnitrophica bacterium]|nr:hypothetical protein [Candidatus Omnitrophota bacterium]
MNRNFLRRPGQLFFARILSGFLILSLGLPPSPAGIQPSVRAELVEARRPVQTLRPANAGMEESPVGEELRKNLRHPLAPAVGMEKASAGWQQDYQKADLSEIPWLRERLNWANRLPAYQSRLVKRKMDGRWRYFLVKSRIENVEEVRGRAVWPDINNPVREVIAARLLRALGCNVCDVEIPDPQTRKRLAEMVRPPPDPDSLFLVQLSSNYLLKDPEVFQTDPLKEQARRIGAALFIRLWDIHDNNSGPLEDSTKLSMMFDAEQAFHPEMEGQESFIQHLIFNYFAVHDFIGLAGSTREENAPKLRQLRIDPLELTDRIDIGELKPIVRDVARLDLADLEKKVSDYLTQQYGRNRQGRLDSQIKPIFERLRKSQKDYPRDARSFFDMLLSGFKYKGVEVSIFRDDENAEGKINRSRQQVEETLRQVAQELASGNASSAGLEEQEGLRGRMPEWLESVMTPEELAESVHRVHDPAIMTDRVAILIKPELLPPGWMPKDPSEPPLELWEMAGNLRGVFAWPEEVMLQIDPWSEKTETAYRERGYRIVRITRDGEDRMRDPIPKELMLLVLSRAVASGSEIFAVNVTHYLRLRGLNADEMRAGLTELYA